MGRIFANKIYNHRQFPTTAQRLGIACILALWGICWNACLLNSPYNVGIDGPNVILGEEGNDRLNEVCRNKVFIEHADSWYQTSKQMPGFLGMIVGTYCASEVMHPHKLYLTKSVDYCQKAIVNIRAKDYTDFISQYVIVRSHVCRFPAVEFFKFTKPFEGSMIVVPDPDRS